MGRLRDYFLRGAGAQPHGPDEDELLMREVEPLEGTRMSLFNSIIPDWWAANVNNTAIALPSLADRVWAANRCIQLNAQQIAAMPIVFSGSREPQWVSNPDPALFPNGIGDVLHAVVENIYGYGYSLQHVTTRYEDGYPRTWTPLPPDGCVPRFDDTGRKVFPIGMTGGFFDPFDIVQIDRNPSSRRAHGTPALAAYGQPAYGLLAAGNQSLTVSTGGIPKVYMQPERKITKDQAEALQAQWMDATSRRNGAPAVVPPELKIETLSFDPSELALLETQEWNSRTIATAYGVPSVILNMALQGGLTYQNPMALMQMWWLTELRTTSKRIMDALTAQMLPARSWISADASDITSETPNSADDPQASQVAKASPAQQPRPLTAIGGTG